MQSILGKTSERQGDTGTCLYYHRAQVNELYLAWSQCVKIGNTHYQRSGATLCVTCVDCILVHASDVNESQHSHLLRDLQIC
eukprot:3946402-Lingulodinium_polyedra.AAC.1